MMKRSMAAVLVSASAMASTALSAPPLEFIQGDAARGAPPVINPEACEGGLRYDDGSYEGGVGFANAVPTGAYVMAFDLPAANFRTESVCLCWTRGDFSNGDAVDFDVVFYAADGVGPEDEPGYPGTFIARVPALAEAVPLFNGEGVAMYPVPLPADLPALPQRVYIGAEWDPFVNRQFFLCNDATDTTPLSEAFNSIDGENWSITSDIRPTYRALGTVVYGQVPPPPPPPEPVPLPFTGIGIAIGVMVLRVLALFRRRHAPPRV